MMNGIGGIPDHNSGQMSSYVHPMTAGSMPFVGSSNTTADAAGNITSSDGGIGGADLADTTTASMMLEKFELETITGYVPPGLPHNQNIRRNSSTNDNGKDIDRSHHNHRRRSRGVDPKDVQWVHNPSDGSVLLDLQGKAISVDRILATKPLKDELSSRKGPGGKQLTYLSGDGVSRTLNDIFGFDGWNLDIKNVEQVGKNFDKSKGRFEVVYIAHVRVTHGRSGSYREDIGSGDSIDKSYATAVGHAIKASITDALKRAARHFGDKLGGALQGGNLTKKNAPATLRAALDTYEIERANAKFGFPKDQKKATAVVASAAAAAAAATANTSSVSTSNSHVQQQQQQPPAPAPVPAPQDPTNRTTNYPNPSHNKVLPKQEPKQHTRSEQSSATAGITSSMTTQQQYQRPNFQPGGVNKDTLSSSNPVSATYGTAASTTATNIIQDRSIPNVLPASATTVIQKSNVQQQALVASKTTTTNQAVSSRPPSRRGYVQNGAGSNAHAAVSRNPYGGALPPVSATPAAGAYGTSLIDIPTLLHYPHTQQQNMSSTNHSQTNHISTQNGHNHQYQRRTPLNNLPPPRPGNIQSLSAGEEFAPPPSSSSQLQNTMAGSKRPAVSSSTNNPYHSKSGRHSF